MKLKLVCIGLTFVCGVLIAVLCLSIRPPAPESRQVLKTTSVPSELPAGSSHRWKPNPSASNPVVPPRLASNPTPGANLAGAAPIPAQGFSSSRAQGHNLPSVPDQITVPAAGSKPGSPGPNPALAAWEQASSVSQAPSAVASAQPVGEAVLEVPTLGVVPAALLDPDPTENLSPEQTRIVDEIANQFLDRVSDPNLGKETQEELDRWVSAQEDADDYFKAQFGAQAFNARSFSSWGTQDEAPAQP